MEYAIAMKIAVHVLRIVNVLQGSYVKMGPASRAIAVATVFVKQDERKTVALVHKIASVPLVRLATMASVSPLAFVETIGVTPVRAKIVQLVFKTAPVQQGSYAKVVLAFQEASVETKCVSQPLEKTVRLVPMTVVALSHTVALEVHVFQLIAVATEHAKRIRGKVVTCARKIVAVLQAKCVSKADVWRDPGVETRKTVPLDSNASTASVSLPYQEAVTKFQKLLIPSVWANLEWMPEVKNSLQRNNILLLPNVSNLLLLMELPTLLVTQIR